MINYKLQHDLIGEEKWPKIPSVFLKGISRETDIDSKFPKEKKEERIQSWKNIAVLRVTSEEPTPFYLGFSNMGTIEYLDHELNTNLDFGIHIGGGDVRVFVLPTDLSKKINLEMVETTIEDNPKYKDLILI